MTPVSGDVVRFHISRTRDRILVLWLSSLLQLLIPPPELIRHVSHPFPSLLGARLT